MFKGRSRAAFDNLPLLIIVVKEIFREGCCTGGVFEDGEVGVAVGEVAAEFEVRE